MRRSEAQTGNDSMDTNDEGDRLADDILDGAEAAAAWTGYKVRAIYHMTRTGQIPHTRRGAKLVFRKSVLKQHFGGAAPA
jgi:hypothetical protein